MAERNILSLIRSGEARTRGELIARTGLSRSTVSQRLSELFDSNLVIVEGRAGSTGGRPASVVLFNASAGMVIAVAIAASRTRVGVVNSEVPLDDAALGQQQGGDVCDLYIRIAPERPGRSLPLRTSWESTVWMTGGTCSAWRSSGVADRPRLFCFPCDRAARAPASCRQLDRRADGGNWPPLSVDSKGSSFRG